MMDNIRYQNGSNMVTDKLFKTARKSYRLSDIEKITFRRTFFWVSLPLAIASYLFLNEFSKYLFAYERVLCVVMYTIVPIACWFIGTLSVTSKSLTNDNAATGYMPHLKQVREAIESAIFTSTDRAEILDDERD